uniref:Asteroid domain-containing protein n=1 Tax=Mola mola TaxID=94237 RepID=A0A3Q4BW57_MOLML
MGVQGLTTYVEGNRRFLQDVKFRDSRLVIDGCSLYFRLYFNHCLDQQHGGDYDAFSCLLSQFFAALAACNIQPYVVLDGGIDPSNKKLPTLRQRLLSKIKEADSLSHGRNGWVLPILTRDVFIQVLTQRGIPLVQCPFEADREIACLAHQWSCPVLTNDSDFYIFDLPGGYLPLHFFQWTNLNGKASHHYISARCYTTNGLCRWFGGLNKMLLPLCAVLTGNDYGAPKGAETLLSLLDLNVSARGGGRGKGNASRIERLLIWLSSFSSPVEALEEVSRLMGDGLKAGSRLSSQLWVGMQEYHITPQSTLARWFSGGKAAPRGWISGLPECLSLAAAQGLLAPLVVDTVVMRRVLLIPQVENSKLASSHWSARALRQAVYGILLLRGHDAQTQVHESIKQGARVEAHPPRYPLSRLGILLEVLGIKEAALTPVPRHLNLAVAVTGFWLQEATPTPSQPQLQALVLGMVYGELSRNSQPGNQQAGEKRGLDVGMAHSLSQWQACLWTALCLNQLLLLPMPEPHLSCENILYICCPLSLCFRLFSGTLVHGLFKCLKGGRAAESLLGGGSGQLYSSLLDAAKNCGCKAKPPSSAAERRKRGQRRGRRGRGRGGRGAWSGCRGTEEINNMFALLMSEDESDDYDCN